jgi:hypothetical protein
VINDARDGRVRHLRGRDQSIVETLMIPLAMIVLDELRGEVPEVPVGVSRLGRCSQTSAEL